MSEEQQTAVEGPTNSVRLVNLEEDLNYVKNLLRRVEPYLDKLDKHPWVKKFLNL